MSPEELIKELSSIIEPLSTAVNQSYWDLNTKYSPRVAEEFLAKKKQLINVYANPGYFKQLKSALGENNKPETSRQLKLIYNSFLMHQIPPELTEPIINLESQIESAFVNYRAQLGSEVYSENELSEKLTNTTSTAEAKLVWEASKQIGLLVAPKIIELVKLRNKAANYLGYHDFFELSLTVNELEATQILRLLADLAKISEAPFLKLKSKLDAELGKKFDLTTSDLRPWHYGDPFFQELPKASASGQLPFYNVNPLNPVVEYYKTIGLNPGPILLKSDLYERPGKSQHAFCTNINQSKDIRILCNIRNNEYWMNTLLHELGHGLYELYLSPELPYFLCTPAHILTTEAIAIMMGRLAKDPQWLQTYLNLNGAESLLELIHNDLVYSELIFIRWGLVMVYFEHQLYSNPNQDLNRLWWQLVSQYQNLTPPTGRSAPDWAAKIHIGTAPVYYQNYLLGEMAASQISSFIKAFYGPDALINNHQSGDFLKEKIFKPGASLPWNQLIDYATGRVLSSDALRAEFDQVKF